MNSKKKKTFINNDIKAHTVRCIGEGGKQYGVISLQEALSEAQDNGLDLVLVSPDANPPVCKIMNYGKFKYQQDKKKKESKKHQKQINIKEIKLSMKIGQNDLRYKVKRSVEFLQSEKYVKFTVVLKGREVVDPQRGIDILEGILQEVSEIGICDKKPTVEGRNISMMVVPKKTKSK